MVGLRRRGQRCLRLGHSGKEHGWVHGTLESKKVHKSLRMRGDARINENLTAVTDERPPPQGSPTEGLHPLVSSVVDCLRGGSPAKPSVCVCTSSDARILFFFACFPCLFLFVSFLLFVFFRSQSIFLSLIFSAYVCHVNTAGSLGDLLKCDNQSKSIKQINQRRGFCGELSHFFCIVLTLFSLSSGILVRRPFSRNLVAKRIGSFGPASSLLPMG